MEYGWKCLKLLTNNSISYYQCLPSDCTAAMLVNMQTLFTHLNNKVINYDEQTQNFELLFDVDTQLNESQ